MARVAVLFALLLLCQLGAWAQSDLQTQKLTIASGGCSAFEFTVPDKYHYDANLVAISLAGCNASSVRLSKLYAQGACISQRDNTPTLNLKQINCQQAEDTTVNTCNTVFADAPTNATLNANSISVGQAFDVGDVCASNGKAYVFVANQCNNPVDVTVKVAPGGNYAGGACFQVAGRSFGWKAILFVVSAVLVALALLLLVCCCCCCR